MYTILLLYLLFDAASSLMYPKPFSVSLSVDELDLTIGPITNTWSFNASSSSPLLISHSSVVAGTTILCYGGFIERQGVRSYNEVIFVFNTTSLQWRNLTRGYGVTAAPTGRSMHTAVLNGDSMLVFGGSGPSYSNELWLWSLSFERWSFLGPASASDTPPRLAGHTAHVVNGKMLVVMGREMISTSKFVCSSDIWEYSTSTNLWKHMAFTVAPPKRYLHASVVYVNMTRFFADVYDGQCTSQFPCIIIHGGKDQESGVLYSDLWIFQTLKAGWTQVKYDSSIQRLADLPNMPPRYVSATLEGTRVQHACATVLDRMFCLGGYDVTGYVDSVEFDPYFNRFFTPLFSNHPPYGLMGHTVSYVPPSIWVIGGLRGNLISSYSTFSSRYSRAGRPGFQNPDGNYMSWSCPKGFIAKERSPFCDLCIPGTYATHTNDTCILCPEGTFNSEFGSTARNACLPCPKGNYSNSKGGSFCKDCPNGFYQDDTSQVRCKPCKPGHFRGYGTATTSMSCSPCPDGYSSTAGSPNCTACEDGFWARSGDPKCTPCPPGTYRPALYYVSCIPCPQGTASPYIGARNSSVCDACPSGAYAGIGASHCTQCPLGQYQLASRMSMCLPCPAGTARGSQSQLTCIECAPGTFQEEMGTESCDECPSSTYSSVHGAVSRTVCQPCPWGTFTNTTGSSNVRDCGPCPPGTWGSVRTSIPYCYECEPGTYNPKSGSSSQSDCLSCPPMTFSSAGAKSCAACPLGSYSHFGWRECAKCSDSTTEGFVRNGHFDLQWKAENFTEQNKWNMSPGSSVAEQSSVSDLQNRTHFKMPSEFTEHGKLTPGFLRFNFSDQKNNGYFHYHQTINLDMENSPRFKCGVWSRSSHLSSTGTSSYMMKITFMSKDTPVESVKRFPSSPSSMSEWIYSEAVHEAPGVLSSIQFELIASGLRPSGLSDSFVDWDDAFCTPLDGDICNCLNVPGSYYDPGNGNQTTELSCTACQPGYACYGGMRFKCPFNQMSFGSASTCLDCLPGWRCSSNGAVPCLGLAFIDIDTNECKICPPGSACKGGSRSLCPPGKYGDGGPDCLLCMPGTFTNRSGMNFCYNCPPGFQSNHMRDSCTACGEGYYSADGVSCKLCSKGYFSLPKSSNCSRCTNFTSIHRRVISLSDVTLRLLPAKCAGESLYKIVDLIETSQPFGVIKYFSSSPELQYRPALPRQGQHSFDVFLEETVSGIKFTVHVILDIDIPTLANF